MSAVWLMSRRGFRCPIQGHARPPPRRFWHGWPPKYRPDVRGLWFGEEAVEVVESLMRLDMGGEFAFDRAALKIAMRRLDAKLSQIVARLPNVLSVEFSALKQESVRADIRKYCLASISTITNGGRLSIGMNLQCSMLCSLGAT